MTDVNDAVWRETQANLETLGACYRHEFVFADDAPFFHSYRCAKCGGTVDSICRHWYERGIEHGRRERESPA